MRLERNVVDRIVVGGLRKGSAHQMVYYFYSFDGLLDESIVAQFSFHILRIRRGRSQSARTPVVDPHGTALLQQGIHKVDPDKPVSPYHQALQRSPPMQITECVEISLAGP